MSKPASPTLIGAFVVGAIALAIVAAGIIGGGRLFDETYDFVLFFESDVNGLKVGSPVKFKGVEVGTVRNILLNIGSMMADTSSSPRIPVIITLDENRFREKGHVAQLDDEARMKQAIESGLRAQLAMESFVTGLLYVKLDIFPDAPLQMTNDPNVDIPEIPTLPTPLEEARMKLAEFFDKLKDIDFAAIVKTARDTLNGIDELVHSAKLKSAIESLDGTLLSFREAADSLRNLSNSVQGVMGPFRETLVTTSGDIGRTLQEARTVLEGVNYSVQPDAPLVYQLNQTLADVSEAARAMRSLADYLERHPDSLLRGKPAPRGDQ